MKKRKPPPYTQAERELYRQANALLRGKDHNGTATRETNPKRWGPYVKR